jgi:hypothetical protein
LQAFRYTGRTTGNQPAAGLLVTRRFRFLTVLFSLLALLLSSAALAGYACPDSAKAFEVAQMVEAGMPCADSMSRAMDEEQPGLCHAHCQLGQQTADSFHPPAFADLMQMGAVLVVRGAPPVSLLADGLDGTPLPRETGPPLSIRNCCFRI